VPASQQAAPGPSYINLADAEALKTPRPSAPPWRASFAYLPAGVKESAIKACLVGKPKQLSDCFKILTQLLTRITITSFSEVPFNPNYAKGFFEH